MLELTAAKKNKVCLSDYPYQRDIENRLLMADFKELDLSVLEEILFSPIKTAVRKIAKNLVIGEETLQPILEKFHKAGLLAFEDDTIVVDKEIRKYFEAEIVRFAPDFKPDMEFLQNLLKKVPIQILPTWFAIPRTSNNIFDSILEKYLITPHAYQRYLADTNLGDPVLVAIAQDVFRSPNLQLSAQEIMEKYGLSHSRFEEGMLLLEFNFLCCLSFHKKDDGWEEVVTPFYEWKEYLSFLKTNACIPIKNSALIERLRPCDHSFLQDAASILSILKKEPQPINPKTFALFASKCDQLHNPSTYLDRIIHKLKLVKLADISEGKLYILDAGVEWLGMKAENRALYFYRHPYNRICSVELPQSLTQEKTIREAEKAVLRVINLGWVLFDEFLKGVTIPLNDKPGVILKRQGKSWKYAIPEYKDDEKLLLEAVIFEWLFETGITAIGTFQGKACFSITPFGQSLFG